MNWLNSKRIHIFPLSTEPTCHPQTTSSRLPIDETSTCPLLFSRSRLKQINNQCIYLSEQKLFCKRKRFFSQIESPHQTDLKKNRSKNPQTEATSRYPTTSQPAHRITRDGPPTEEPTLKYPARRPLFISSGNI